MITIERVWQMGKDTRKVHYMARVGDQPAQMFWQSRDSKLGRLLEQIESMEQATP